MTDLPTHGRRRLLAMLAALPAMTRAGTLWAAPARAAPVAPAQATPFAAGPTLLVAGPGNGVLEGWADAVQPAIEQSLPPDTAIHRLTVGGADGVTGANQFEARGAPDGLTVLLAPGQAALAWLVGDPRAQFDVGRWLPVMAGLEAGIVVGRPAAFAPNRPIRVAASDAAGLELPAILGLDLLGNRAEPVLGLGESDAALAAFANGAVNAVFLRGNAISAQLPVLAAAGAQPLFSLGTRDEGGRLIREPTFPDLPHMSELYSARTGRLLSGALFDAWCAATAAVQLEFGLVLPQLTPAAMVAQWRRAATDAAAAIGVQSKGAYLGVRPLGGPVATANATAIAADASAMLELRRWLANRFDWRPRP